MATIVTRASKGAPLTHAEMDANFTNLNSGKQERDANGGSFFGSATALRPLQIAGGASTIQVQSSGLPAETPGFGSIRHGGTNAGAAAAFAMARSRGTTDGATTLVASGDTLGYLSWCGADGTLFQEAARISAQVDGVAAANDMPGRLVFSTTTDGAAAPTEKMRLDNAGNLGLGAAPTDFVNFTRSTNAGIRIVATNASTGAGAQARIVVSNGTAETGLIMRGTAFTGEPNAAYLYVTGANPLVFSLNGANIGRIDSAGLLLMGLATATGDAKIQVSNGMRIDPGTVSADVNTLDYYQEGSFTPVVVGAATAGTGTYTTQTGRYTRIGNRVFITIRVLWTAHTGTGTLDISGLPFTVGSLASPLSIMASNLTFTGQLCCYAQAGTTLLRVATAATGVALAGLAMDTAADLFITGSYEV